MASAGRRAAAGRANRWRTGARPASGRRRSNRRTHRGFAEGGGGAKHSGSSRSDGLGGFDFWATCWRQRKDRLLYNEGPIP